MECGVERFMVQMTTDEEKAAVWDEAIQQVRGHVTPFIWRKLLSENPYRKEKSNA